MARAFLLAALTGWGALALAVVTTPSFGHGYTGVASASAGYFGAAVTDLSWGQAALLAGLPYAPAALDPFVHLSAARQREQYVLERLVATGDLTATAADAAFTEPLHLVSNRSAP